jgi:imidazolonepropionase-like amidohydrolase
MTAAGEVFEDGVVVLANGRIRAVGAASEVQVPDEARVIDAEGRFVTPGVIDTHSHMGVYAVPHVRATSDGNEATGPVTAGVWAGDSVWPQDPALPRAIAGGVTTIHVLPGSANLVGGRGVTLKMHLGRTLTEMLFPGAPDTVKMACGENPKRVYGARNSAPATRMGNVLGYRNAFQAAREYGRQWTDWQHNHRLWQARQAAFERGSVDGADAPDDPGPSPAPPSRDFGKETLLQVLQGESLVQMHCYRGDEMVRMTEVAADFGFGIRSFHHAVEAYKVRDILAARDVGVSTWADWWGFKLEAYDSIQENLALLTEAGVRAVMHSDSNMLIQRLNQEAAKAMWAGRRGGIEITDDQALRWITANAAWTLGIEDETGTLEAGKMADVVVWSASPFSVYSRADLVFIDGLLRFDRREGARAGTTDFEVGQDLGGAP